MLQKYVENKKNYLFDFQKNKKIPNFTASKKRLHVDFYSSYLKTCFRMKILHRFMLKQFMGPFVAAFFIVIITLLMQFLWKYIDDLVGKGLEVSVFCELLLYNSLMLSNMAFPLAVLLASIFTLGNMGENYELIALKAAGISLQRIVFPLIVLSFVISISAFAVANNVVPWAWLKWRTLIYDIQQQRPELRIQEEIFFNEIEGYSIRIGKRDYKTNMLYEMWIYDHTDKVGNVSVIIADSGRMAMSADKRFLEMTLFNGHSYQDIVDPKKPASRQNKNYPFRHDFFDKQVFRIVLPNYGLERSDEQLFRSGAQMMNLPQLANEIDSFSKIINSQEQQLRMTVKPVYDNPTLKNIPVDTTLRKKIPDDFWVAFNQMSKQKRQTAVKEAVNNARSQKDQVAGLIYDLDDKNKRIWRFKIEWHRKFTVAIACFIFFFIGAPLGAIIRKGGLGTPIIIAVIFFVLYYVISMIGEKSAKEGALTPFSGMWLSAFIILSIGIFLTLMATRDSPIFNQELYLNYIKKGLSFIFVAQHKSRPEIVCQFTSIDLMPENMLAKLEKLSQLCKGYLEGDFRKSLKIREIWHKQQDMELAEIGSRYDHIRTILKESDIEMIRETVIEYPRVSLHDYKIKKISSLLVVTAAVIFPVWFYLYVKAWIQKYTLRNDLRNMISANRNLINELNSIV